MATFPAHEIQTSGLSTDGNKISIQQGIDGNCSILDLFNADGKKYLQAYILEGVLETSIENSIRSNPRDVHISIR